METFEYTNDNLNELIFLILSVTFIRSSTTTKVKQKRERRYTQKKEHTKLYAITMNPKLVINIVMPVLILCLGPQTKAQVPLEKISIGEFKYFLSLLIFFREC